MGEQRGIGHHPELAVLLLEHAEEIDFWREQFELRQLDSVIVSMEILHLWRQAGETCHAALEAHELDPDVQAALLMRAAEAFDWAWMPRERDAALDLLVHEHADSVEGRKAAKWRERLPPPGP